jgi:hypothetical protein
MKNKSQGKKRGKKYFSLIIVLFAPHMMVLKIFKIMFKIGYEKLIELN